MYCHNCGEKLPDDALFCGKCGAKAGEVEVQSDLSSQNQSSGGNSLFSNRKVLITVCCAAGVLVVVLGIILVILLVRGSDGNSETLAEITEEQQESEETDENQDADDGDTNVEDTADVETYEVKLQLCSAEELDTEAGIFPGGVAGASVTIREGEDNRQGETVWTGVSDDGGSLTIELPSGSYTAEIDDTGYALNYVNLEVKDTVLEKNIYMMKEPKKGQTALLLTWDGTTEKDLDLAIFTPYQDSNGNTSYIGGDVLADDYGNYILHDNSMGCEAAYIDTSGSGTYTIRVNDYTDSIAGDYEVKAYENLDAHLYVFQQDGQVTELRTQGNDSGVIWEAAEINGNRISDTGRICAQTDGRSWWTVDKEDTELVLADCEKLSWLMFGVIATKNDYHFRATLKDYDYENEAISTDEILFGLDMLLPEPFSHDVSAGEIQDVLDSYENVFIGDGEPEVYFYFKTTREEVEKTISMVTGRTETISDAVWNQLPDQGEMLDFWIYILGDNLLFYMGDGYYTGFDIEADKSVSTYLGGGRWQVEVPLNVDTSIPRDARATFVVFKNSESYYDGYSIESVGVNWGR